MSTLEAMKQARKIIWRYRHETPLGNQPYMVAHEADEFFNRIDQAIAEAEKKPPPEQWRERWYGSGSERGWWIVCGRNHIAHLGEAVSGNEVTKIVDAHNRYKLPAQQPEAEKPSQQMAQQSFMSLWQSYCDKKMECEDLKEKLAEAEPSRSDIKQECCGNPFKCKGNCVDKEQEPVNVPRWQDELRENHPSSDPQYWPDELIAKYARREVDAYRAQPLYTSPPPVAEPHKWVGLTDDELESIWPFVWRTHESVRHLTIYRAIEAKLKEKNQ